VEAREPGPKAKDGSLGGAVTPAKRVHEDRGEWRGTYRAILSDPDYQRLAPDAKLMLWTLLHYPGGNMAGVLMPHLDVLRGYTGLTERRAKVSLDELELAEWIVRQGPVLWIRNALRFDVGKPLRDSKKVAGIQRILRGLPPCSLLWSFAEYYGLEPSDRWPRPGGDPNQEDLPLSPIPNSKAKAKEGLREPLPKPLGKGLAKCVSDTDQWDLQEIKKAARGVYRYYLARTGKSEGLYRLTPKRLRAIVRRLRDWAPGDGEKILRMAIDAMAADPWEGRGEFNDLIDYVLKDEETVEKWIAKGKKWGVYAETS